MSSTRSAGSRKRPSSLVRSISDLSTTVTKKFNFNRSNKVAPLFVAPCTEDDEFEDVVELACGHIFRTKDVNSMRCARSGLLGNNNILANLSIFEATRCPTCESELLSNKDIGNHLPVAVSNMIPGQKRELLRSQGTERADKQSHEEGADRKPLEPSADVCLDMSPGKL